MVGAINCDGTYELGQFWSRVLEWPLVWDDVEAQETAIQSPDGGSKITWSGPPLIPRHGRHRWRLAVRAAPDASSDDAVRGLLSAGATLPDAAAGLDEPGDERVLLDPDGNAFILRA